MTSETTKQVPPAALQFNAGPLEFMDGDDADKGKAPIKMLARTGQPVEHWYWGRIVHDMKGMFHKDSIPVDYCHRRDEIIGFLNEFDTKSHNLVVAGELVSFTAEDRASEVMHKGLNGIPYEASINFNGSGIKIEELGIGAKATVNGFVFEGPGVIVREWPLRGVAVCPYGVDQNTKSEFSGDEEKVAVTLFSERNESMSKEKKTDTAATDNAAELGEQSGDASKTGTSNANPAELSETKKPAAKPADDSRAQFNADLKRFVDRFGADGAAWFAADKSYEEALELHAQSLEAGQSDKDKELTAAKEKFASLDRGEEEPAEFNDSQGEVTDKRTAEFQSQLGDNLGRFAAGIRLPQPSKN